MPRNGSWWGVWIECIKCPYDKLAWSFECIRAIIDRRCPRLERGDEHEHISASDAVTDDPAKPGDDTEAEGI